MNKSTKVVLFGLDGTPYTLLKQLTQNNVMPRVSEIIREGSFFQMNASIPEISSVSWSNFMTGKNPAKHGIFGFTDLKPSSYSIKFPNFLDIKTDTIWDILERYNKRSIVINLPATYPARQINGVLVSGFVAIDLEKAVYPHNIYEKLKNMGYSLDVDFQLVSKSLDEFLNNIFKTLDIREKAFEYFWRNEQWDFFNLVITGTDRLHHYFWDAYEDKFHKLHSRFLEYYKKIDDIIGKFYNLIDDDTIFILISDHGFSGIDKEIYLNNLFLEMGFLKYNTNEKSLENINSSTIAFVLDPGRVYINVKGRFPAGSVEKGKHYDEVVDEVIENILSFTIPEYRGLKPIKNIYKVKDIYNGEYLDYGPDLIICPNNRFDLKATLTEEEIYGKRIFTGMHTYDDAFFYINKKINTKRKPNIIDVAPTILSCFGFRPGPEMDGTSLIDS